MIDWTNDKIVELTALVRAAAVLLAVVMVAYAYLKTRSLVTLLVAALTAGFFLWTINNTDWWQQRVEEESRAPTLVVSDVEAWAGAGSDTALDVGWTEGGWRG